MALSDLSRHASQGGVLEFVLPGRRIDRICDIDHKKSTNEVSPVC